MSSSAISLAFRSANSFGVSGLLSSSAKIFHQILTDGGGVGRVADLVAARLRDTKADPFRIHALVVFGALGAGRAFGSGSAIRFECGADDRQVALAFSFECAGFAVPEWDGIAERIASGAASSPVEELLLAFSRNADHVVLRGHPATGRVELCAVIAQNASRSLERAPVEVVLLSDELEEAPRASEYTALGDLDYARMLSHDGGADGREGPVTGEVLVHEAASAEALLVRIRSRRLQLEDSTVIRISEGAAAMPDSSRVIVVRGGAPTPSGDIRIAGAPALSEIAQQADDAEKSELELAAKALERTMTEGALDRVAHEAAEIRAEVRTPQVERWVEGLTAELQAEKARIVEVSNKLAGSIRQKEIEFRSQENALRQEIKSRDEQLRLKSLQVTQLKDRVASLQVSLERAKMGAGSADDAVAKHKIGNLEKRLRSSRAEIDTLKARLDDARSKLHHSSEHKGQTVPMSEHAELLRKCERLDRELEELKHQESPESLRSRLESAQRAALQLRERNELLEREIQKRQVELEGISQELERLRGARPGSDAA